MKDQPNDTLFLPFPAWGPEDLEVELSSRVARPVSITLTRNRTSMASFLWKRGSISIRLHQQFLNAPPDLIDALAFWIKKPRNGVPKPIQDFIRSIPDSPTPARAGFVIRPEGCVYNLNLLANRVNRRFFGDSLDVRISWGRDMSGRSVRHRRLGSYQHDAHLIIIHPVLDDERVPEFVLRSIIHHEMLHALQSPGMPRPHDAAFRKAEQVNPDFGRSEKWLKSHVSLIYRGRRHKTH
ncbi:MAG: hypothetical protein V2A56_01300 [bacterium]